MRWYCASCGETIPGKSGLYLTDEGTLLHDEGSCGPVLSDVQGRQPPDIGKQAAFLLAESDDVAWDIRQTAIVMWAFKVREFLKPLGDPPRS